MRYAYGCTVGVSGFVEGGGGWVSESRLFSRGISGSDWQSDWLLRASKVDDWQLQVQVQSLRVWCVFSSSWWTFLWIWSSSSFRSLLRRSINFVSSFFMASKRLLVWLGLASPGRKVSASSFCCASSRSTRFSMPMYISWNSVPLTQWSILASSLSISHWVFGACEWDGCVGCVGCIGCKSRVGGWFLDLWAVFPMGVKLGLAFTGAWRGGRPAVSA